MSRNESAGILYAFGASLALAGSFVFSKSVLNQLTMVHFGALWFSLGVFWNGIWFFSRREYRQLSGQWRRRMAVALLVALLEGAATGLFYLAIQAMKNPAVVSFIGNIGPVFVTLMAMILLGERFRRSQQAGIGITLAGIFIINYREGGFSGFLDPGSIYVIGASFLFAVATLAGRSYRKLMNPGLMSLLRSLILSLVMLGLFFRDGGRGLVELPGAVWRDLVLGSVMETLIVIVFAYRSLQLIEATRTSLVISSKGVWTLVFAWVFLDVFPEPFQLAGGILALVGVWLITWDRPLFR